MTQQSPDLAPDASIRLAGDGAAVNDDGALRRHNIGLHTARDHADINGGMSQQTVPTAAQLRGVTSFQQIHDARHFMHGVCAKFGARAVGGTLPWVSNLSHKLPLCAVTTCKRVGSPTMARSARKPEAANAREPAWPLSSSTKPAKMISVAAGRFVPCARGSQSAASDCRGHGAFGVA